MHCERLKGYRESSHSAVNDCLVLQVPKDGDMFQESGRREKGDLATDECHPYTAQDLVLILSSRNKYFEL